MRFYVTAVPLSIQPKNISIGGKFHYIWIITNNDNCLILFIVIDDIISHLIDLNFTVVVGLVVGLVALLIGIGLVLFLILFVRKRRKKQKSEMNEEEQQVKRERLAAVESDMMSTVVNNDNQILITQTYSTYQPGIDY